MYTKQQLITALTNLQWMINHYQHSDGDGATFDSGTETLVYGDGGASVDALTEEGFTPATRKST